MKGPKAKKSISQINFITKNLRGDNFQYHTNIERITIRSHQHDYKKKIYSHTKYTLLDA